MTTRRYCTTCQSSQLEEGGYKKPGSNRGWRCATCLACKSESIYKNRSGRAADVKKIMEDLYRENAA